MKYCPFTLALITVVAASLAWAFPAHASAGGSTLAFNSTFDTIASNVQGPTANAIATIVFVIGLATYAISKDSGFMKTVGGTVMGVVLVAKAPALLSELGLAGAAAVPYGYLPLALPLAGIPLLMLLIGIYLATRRYTNQSR